MPSYSQRFLVTGLCQHLSSFGRNCIQRNVPQSLLQRREILSFIEANPVLITVGNESCRICFRNRGCNLHKVTIAPTRKNCTVKHSSSISTQATMTTLERVNFDNLVLKSLPIDEDRENSRRQVRGACFSLVRPTPVKNATMVAYSTSAMKLLDLAESELLRPEAAEYFSGNKILPGSETAAHCYCGHQFGSFAGQLGDGAAIYLGEVLNQKGERWECQLKGAGLTPFSRTADGRKVLRSSIREFLCSEAMHHLGIPTTRAGTCVTSDTTIIRDVFYDGHPIEEKATVVLRIAPTFIRFGSFEIFKSVDPDSGRQGPSSGRREVLEALVNYVIKTFYPEIFELHKNDVKQCVKEFFKEVVLRTARLVADWQCVGWCHGVLNTDNMSIVGLTIDYGPYGFMDRYQSNHICNGSDNGGRYCYERQPEMCRWNCGKLAEMLAPFVPLHELDTILELFDAEFDRRYKMIMMKKLGLLHIQEDADMVLVSSFLDTMQKTGADFTNSFRCLGKLPLPASPDFGAQLKRIKDDLLAQCCSLDELRNSLQPRIDPRQLQMFLMIMRSNPELASQLGGSMKSIADELERIEKRDELQNKTAEDKVREDGELWEKWLSTYVDRLKRESDASVDKEAANFERANVMNSTNPRFVLRNYIAQKAIEEAEKGNFSEVRRVLRLLEQPYSDFESPDSVTHDEAMAGPSRHPTCSAGRKDFAYDDRPPAWAQDLRVT